MEYVRYNRNGGTTRHQTHSSVQQVNTSLIDSEGNVVKERHTFRDKRVRTGKTARDRANGAPARREGRRQARAAWINETRSKVYSSRESVPAFPV